MSKFTCLVLYAVAVSLSSIYAGGNKEYSDPINIESIISECMKENRVTNVDLMVLEKTRDVRLITPCFWGCCLTKAGLLNDKGQFELDAALTTLKKFTGNEEEYTHIAEIAKQCESVKDKDVSDGEAGCERGTLLIACYVKQMEASGKVES